jgi:hypothetical protein
MARMQDYEVTTRFGPGTAPVPAGEGFAVQPRFTVAGKIDGFTVEIEVVIEGGPPKARARRVAVESDTPRGVSSTNLRRVPIRDMVGDGLLSVLMRVELLEKGAKLTPAPRDEATRRAVEALVGYIEVGESGAITRKKSAARKRVAR